MNGGAVDHGMKGRGAAAGAAAGGSVSHEQAFELLPWLANGTLGHEERQRVERHVRDCLTCRAELKEQQALGAIVHGHPTVHLSPEKGFERLRRAMEAPAAAEGASTLRGRWRAFGRRHVLRGTRALAAAAAVCVALGGALWLGWSAQRQSADERRAPRYATAAEQQGELAEIDVIFADGTTEEQMRALLAEIDATIVGGPTSIGRYTLRLRAPADGAPDAADEAVDSLLRRLAADARVRFAGPSFAPAAAAGERP